MISPGSILCDAEAQTGLSFYGSPGMGLQRATGGRGGLRILIMMTESFADRGWGKGSRGFSWEKRTCVCDGQSVKAGIKRSGEVPAKSYFSLEVSLYHIAGCGLCGEADRYRSTEWNSIVTVFRCM